MRKFLLLDYSLDRIGGHNYEYDRLCLEAAQAAGFQPILAAQETFRVPFGVSTPWAIHCVYPRGKYSAHRLGQRLARLEPSSKRRAGWLTAGWRSLKQWYYLKENARFHTRLARATRELVQKLELRSGDQVYLPTISFSDLPGLAEYFQSDCFQSDSAARHVDWHLQFHLPLATGEHAADPAKSLSGQLAQGWLRECVRAMPGRLHLYATTVPLAAQYSALDAAEFQPLPWLIDPAFHLASPVNDRLPLRLLYSGGMRKEKGFSDLPRILESLWGQYFLSGRLQLVLQAPSRESLPAAWQSHALLQADPDERTRAPIAVSPFPMQSDQYRQFVRSADVGMLLYEPEAYAIRCSGICLEMLSAGVPIIVRDGTWLADQVREGNEQVGVQGEVGLIANGTDDVANQIRHIADRYGDYRRAALQFSDVVARRHHPQAVLGVLLQSQTSRLASAA